MPWLDQTLSLLLAESNERRPGSQSVVDHLAQVVFIQAIRASLNMPSRGTGSWMSALMDPDIALALNLMHTRLDSPWTVATLAHRVHLSRSAFASRFTALLATSPMQYLMERRMERASQLLAEERYGIKQVAAQVGYASKSAFSNAFRRWNGKSPQAYRQCRSINPASEHTDAGPGR